MANVEGTAENMTKYLISLKSFLCFILNHTEPLFQDVNPKLLTINKLIFKKCCILLPAILDACGKSAMFFHVNAIKLFSNFFPSNFFTNGRITDVKTCKYNFIKIIFRCRSNESFSN